MKKLTLLLALSVIAAPALAGKPCEELKSEIAAKLDKRGVAKYQLDIVPAGDVKEQKVIGSCEGGKKRITYKKG